MYGIAAESIADIQKGVVFARIRNIPLIIKNTGYDFLGSSTRKGALQIWTHRMENIHFTENFVAKGCER